MSGLVYYIPEPDTSPPAFPGGTFGSEEKLLGALQAFDDRHGVPPSLTVHVYETDATSLGIGRKHLGTIAAGSVLMADGVDLDRVRSDS